MDPIDEPLPPRKLAFIGLGVMGYPMAGHLARAGHDVTVYNRSPARAAAWVAEYGGRAAATPRAAAAGAACVFCCVGNDDSLRDVLLGDDGALAGMRAGAVLVDHTTASAAIARELDGLARARGLRFVDAPVSGGQAGAAGGVLTVMCGGDADAVATMKPLAAAYARAVTHVGPSGAGQLAKMVNQTCVAGVLQGLAEGIAFGRNAGLDMALVLEVIGKGAAQSWQMDHRGPAMVEGRFDFGFAVDWMRKDLGLVLDEAERNGSRLPLVRLLRGFYDELSAAGDGRLDTSSLIKRLLD